MIRIRPGTYKLEPGFFVRGTGPGPDGRRYSVFTTTRTSAERIAERARRNEQVQMEDFRA